MGKNFEILCNKLAGKIYILILFEPMSVSRIAEELYGNKRQKDKIIRILKQLEKYDFAVRNRYNEKAISTPWESFFIDEKLPKNFNSREIFWRAKLSPIFEFWTDQISHRKKDFVLLFEKDRSRIKEILKINEGTDLNIKLSEVMKEIAGEEEFIEIQKLFFAEGSQLHNKNIFFKSNFFKKSNKIFRQEILPYIQMPFINFDALEFLTTFFIFLFDRAYFLNILSQIEKQIDTVNETDIKKVIQNRVQGNRFMLGHLDIDEDLLELYNVIGHEKIVKLHNGLVLIKQINYSSYELAENFFGKKNKTYEYFNF